MKSCALLLANLYQESCLVELDGSKYKAKKIDGKWYVTDDLLDIEIERQYSHAIRTYKEKRW